MEHLLAKIDSLLSQMKAHQEKVDAHHEKMMAGQEEWMAMMKVTEAPGEEGAKSRGNGCRRASGSP
jgi:hypothetical protein